MAPVQISPIIRFATQRRAFSVGQGIRHAARSFEPHPFERFPTTVKPAKADWGRQGRRVGDALMFYVPFLGFVLTWPLLGAKILDGHMGDL